MNKSAVAIVLVLVVAATMTPAHSVESDATATVGKLVDGLKEHATGAQEWIKEKLANPATSASSSLSVDVEKWKRWLSIKMGSDAAGADVPEHTESGVKGKVSDKLKDLYKKTIDAVDKTSEKSKTSTSSPATKSPSQVVDDVKKAIQANVKQFQGLSEGKFPPKKNNNKPTVGNPTQETIERISDLAKDRLQKKKN